MTDVSRLALTDAEEVADLAAFLGRQLRWDKAAAARLKATGRVLAVFTRPARFGVLAVRPGALREETTLDVTVSAGELLEGLDAPGRSLTVPGEVTGPSWAGLLPPQGGWQRLVEVPGERARAAAAALVAEFRDRTEQLPQSERTRAVLDALAEEIWSRPLPGTSLPLRALHAAHALGFLHASAQVDVRSSGAWLRLRTPAGSIAVRQGGVPGLSVTPA